MMLRRSFFALFLAVSSVAVAQTPTTAPSDLIQNGPATQPAIDDSKPLVIIQEGTLPVIISAPHGGRRLVPDAPRRTGANVPRSKTKKTFTTAFDGGTLEVALLVADEVEKQTGKRPYVVVANFSRRYADANRTPAEAYESDAGQAVYDQYHGAIRRFRDKIIAENGRGLIIDIHGQGRDANAIIRGTADWTSAKHLVEAHGKEAYTGPTGLLGPLAAAGNKFTPPNDQPDEKEFEALNGGFITRNYGSYQGGTFDSIQLELGGKFRKKENAPTFAKQLAEGIKLFADHYLTEPPATQPAAQ